MRSEVIHADRYGSLGELLLDALVQFKSEIALVEMSRKRELERITYREMKRRADRLARRLQDLGIGGGDRVAILMSNQSKWLIAATAALFRGAVLVPLDYKLTPPEQLALLAHARPAVLFVEAPLAAQLGPSSVEVPHVIVSDVPAGIEIGTALRYEECLADGPAPDYVARSRADEATIVYSSGTGGRPKGCILTHDCYLEQYRSLIELFPLRTGDRYFSVLPTNHAIDFMCGFVGPLGGGATVVHQRALRPEYVRSTMKAQRITHMAVVPLLLEAFERAIQEKLDEATPLKRQLFDGLRSINAALTRKVPSQAVSRTLLRPVHDAFGGELRLLFCGGAFVDRDRAQLFYDLGIPVVIGYGLTEACTVATVNDLRPFRADSVGRAVDGVEVEVRAAGEDGVGEVFLRGRTVMKGYLDDPEQTAEVLVDGWLRTGDLGWLDASGHLHLVGRSKNMIVTAGGKNIYPEDIEGAFDGLPCDELCVMATNYVWPATGLAFETLVAVVRGGGENGFRDELRGRNLKLPDFKRVHGVVEWTEPFPRTASMKVKRAELARLIRELLPRGAVNAI